MGFACNETLGLELRMSRELADADHVRSLESMGADGSVDGDFAQVDSRCRTKPLTFLPNERDGRHRASADVCGQLRNVGKSRFRA
ncbi:hypothetical protein RE429_05425 [Microvirga sp. M2]